MKKLQTTPDRVCAVYARKGAKITVRPLEAVDDVLVIEGDSKGLEFLGKLLLAQASTTDCGFHLNPNGAGKTFFGRKSTTGIYIHRLPCEQHRQRKSSTKGLKHDGGE